MKSTDLKILWFDVETTGTDAKKNSIHQLSALMDIGGTVVAQFNVKFRSDMISEYNKQTVKWWSENPEMGLSKEVIEGREVSHKEAHGQFMEFLNHHIKQFDSTDKATIAGFNVHFDEQFLRHFMDRYNDTKYNLYGSYFWSGRICVLSDFCRIAAYRRKDVKKVTLENCCQSLSIDIDNAHDALVDVRATRALSQKINHTYWNTLYRKLNGQII